MEPQSRKLVFTIQTSLVNQTEDIFCFISVMSHLRVYLTTLVTDCVFTDARVNRQMREMSSEKKEG